ncbi:MAG: UbiA family prenyltransferase [Saprospiraceae bacterium]|nr:UbiA family prenyltransferase [Lewinella sp.]
MLKKLIDLILYSNLWIAFCATSMCWQTQWMLSGSFTWAPLAAFILFATLLLYALHRLVGLSRAEGFKDKGRYFVIEHFQLHIGLYAVLAGLAALWYAWQLSWQVWWWMLPGMVLSAGYVLPIFGKGKRLRDFHYIKIFLIALAWSWITVVVPAVDLGLHRNIPLAFLFLERVCFVFAITLPFDIRDLEIDRANGVMTLPAMLGVVRTRQLAYLLLGLSAALGWMAFDLNAYNTGSFTGLIISLLISAVVIGGTRAGRHDYFFTGLVDGLMVVQFLLVWLLS